MLIFVINFVFQIQKFIYKQIVTLAQKKNNLSDSVELELHALSHDERGKLSFWHPVSL